MRPKIAKTTITITTITTTVDDDAVLADDDEEEQVADVVPEVPGWISDSRIGPAFEQSPPSRFLTELQPPRLSLYIWTSDSVWQLENAPVLVQLQSHTSYEQLSVRVVEVEQVPVGHSPHKEPANAPEQQQP